MSTDFASLRSVLAVIGVVTVADVGAVAPPPVTVTVLSTDAGAALLIATVTVTAGKFAPAANAPVREQLNALSPTAPVHAQPVPDGNGATRLKPLGRVSVNTTGSVLLIAPAEPDAPMVML